MRYLQLAMLIVMALPSSARAVDAGGGLVAKEGVPGGTAVTTIESFGTVVALEAAERAVTLRMENGKISKINVSSDAINFDQIAVGDVVRIFLTEQLVIGMTDALDPSKEEVAGVVSLAPQGAQPAGVMAKTTRLTATVTAIDMEKRLATLTFADGAVKIIKVRPDIDLKARKVGESVTFLITEAIAVKVEKAAAK